ncbi:hypothetical protein J7E79_23590 [Bacillus sp. ISL-40]|nr:MULTISPECIES: hypothetical protein [unclassified Bacillus (in: firmicutes)]MBT2700348.1 hypothetical protein [Bacillus sp. ISL-40]MBT2740882.1 hypothetical protein [Bacillus sp. ISL-77]
MDLIVAVVIWVILLVGLFVSLGRVEWSALVIMSLIPQLMKKLKGIPIC